MNNITDEILRLMNYFLNPFKQLFDFKGKSTPQEFWYFVAINLAISFLLILTKKLHGIENIDIYYRYVYIIPLIALGFRRLRDAGFNVWFFLIPFANFVLAGFPSKAE